MRNVIKSYRDLAAVLQQLPEEELDQPIRVYQPNEPNEESELFTVQVDIERDANNDPFLDLNFIKSDFIDR